MQLLGIESYIGSYKFFLLICISHWPYELLPYGAHCVYNYTGLIHSWLKYIDKRHVAKVSAMLASLSKAYECKSDKSSDIQNAPTNLYT